MISIFDSFESAEPALAVVVGAIGGLTVAATGAAWRKHRNRRRESRIARAGSVEDWEAARGQPVIEEKRVPWLKLAGNAVFGSAFAAVPFLVDGLNAVFGMFALLGLVMIAWDHWLKRTFPEQFEDEEADDYFGNSREPYIPSEASWGFVAALAMVALIVGAIAVFR